MLKCGLGLCGERAKVFTQIIARGNSHKVILTRSDSHDTRTLPLFLKGMVHASWFSSGTFPKHTRLSYVLAQAALTKIP